MCKSHGCPPPGPSASERIPLPYRKPFLTTREATDYCGFKTTGALRKAAREGRITPVGRRGGLGTWMWLRDDLDAFLCGPSSRRPETEQRIWKLR